MNVDQAMFTYEPIEWMMCPSRYYPWAWISPLSKETQNRPRSAPSLLKDNAVEGHRRVVTKWEKEGVELRWNTDNG